MNFSRFSAFSAITGSAERKNSLQMRRFQTISEFSHSLDPFRSLNMDWRSGAARGFPHPNLCELIDHQSMEIRYRDAQPTRAEDRAQTRGGRRVCFNTWRAHGRRFGLRGNRFPPEPGCRRPGWKYLRHCRNGPFHPRGVTSRASATGTKSSTNGPGRQQVVVEGLAGFLVRGGASNPREPREVKGDEASPASTRRSRSIAPRSVCRRGGICPKTRACLTPSSASGVPIPHSQISAIALCPPGARRLERFLSCKGRGGKAYGLHRETLAQILYCGWIRTEFGE